MKQHTAAHTVLPLTSTCGSDPDTPNVAAESIALQNAIEEANIYNVDLDETEQVHLTSSLDEATKRTFRPDASVHRLLGREDWQ